MNGKFLLFVHDEIDSSIMRFADRMIRQQRRDERRLAEQRTTKHQFQARKSCIYDARSYRLARRLPVPTADSSFANGIGHSIRDALVASYLSLKAIMTANKISARQQ